MSFTDEQVAALSADLSKKAVRTRKQAGRDLSYVEGWFVISEANRIFGFDAWDRETVDIRQLGEPREVDGKWRVGYMARVRFTVRTPGGLTVVREGCGFGSGIDRDVGQAHESALKESETDAAKRAMSTFGNPFGLALYDKTQAHVSDAPAAEKPADKPADPPQSERVNRSVAHMKPHAIPAPKGKTPDDWTPYCQTYTDTLGAVASADAFYAWVDANAETLQRLANEWPEGHAGVQKRARAALDRIEPDPATDKNDPAHTLVAG